MANLTQELRVVTYALITILLIGGGVTGCLPIPTASTPTPTFTPDVISYTVQVTGQGTGEGIPYAQIRLDLAGIAPLRATADTDGFARICVPISHLGEPAKLTVTATDYVACIRHIDLLKDLPEVVPLETEGDEPQPEPPPPDDTDDPAPEGHSEATPTAPSEPSTSATATLGASIFVCPDADSQVGGGVSAGEQVEVLGRSAVGNWFYIRDGQGVEGFVYAPRFNWQGDYESLPVVEPKTLCMPDTPAPPTQETNYDPLTMDLWENPGTGQCSDGGVWDKSIYICGHGGDGNYTYYWNGEKVGGPTSDSLSFNVHSVDAAIIGIGKVVSGDGQVVEQELYVRVPDCAK